MRLQTGVSVFFLALPLIAMAAPALSVSYVDGTAYLGTGSSWKELSIGDSATADVSIRLDAGASVELTGIGVDITLTQKGTYSIRDLLAARQKIGSPGVGKALSASMAYLLTGPAHNQSTAAGARGANESKSADSEWVETSAQENIQQAKDSIQAAKYDEAIEKLTQTLDEATDEELPEVHYYLAYAYSLNGSTIDAVKQLAGVKPSSGASWAGDFILLQAKLYLDTFAFPQAIQWLTQPGNDLSGDAQRAPIYYYLLGLGYQEIGDGQNAKQSLSKVVAIAGGSDLGKSAAGLLQNQ